MEDKKFILTKDVSLKTKLLNAGYELLVIKDDTYLFINAPNTFCFDEIDKSVFVFTNIAFF